MSLSQQQLEQLSANCSIASYASQNIDEDAWLHARTKGIGGSDVGAICGVNKWTSALQIYFSKTGQYLDSNESSAAAQERMHFGHVLEPVVAEEFADRLNADVQRVYLVEAECSFSSNEHPVLLANVDRFVIDIATGQILGILECKTASETMNSEWANGDIPQSYYYQVQHYLYVTGLQHAWIACLVGGNKFYMYDIFFDSHLYTSVILPKLLYFWNENVLKLKAPDTQGADDELLDKLFPASSVEPDEPMDLSDARYDEIAVEIEKCKVAKKKAEQRIKELQAEIKKALQHKTTGYSLSYRFSWSPRQRTGLDTARLKLEHPEIYEEYSTITSYRQMSIKRMVEDAD